MCQEWHVKYHDIFCTQFRLYSAMETRGYTVRDVIIVFGRAHLTMMLCKELPTHLTIPNLIPEEVRV
jgi:hypothetical protein